MASSKVRAVTFEGVRLWERPKLSKLELSIGIAEELEHLALQRLHRLAMYLPNNRDRELHGTQMRGIAELARRQHELGGVQVVYCNCAAKT